MRHTARGIAALMVGAASMAAAGDIGFVEDFALAKDRDEALKQLIPGTEDYYFYHCLHCQNTGKLDQVDALLKTWIERHNRTPRVLEMENRQALLRYGADPKGSLEFIRGRLNLEFNHQRELLDEKPKLPAALDPNLISRERLTRRALEKHPATVNGFEDRGLDGAVGLTLTPEQRRSLLARLTRPDYPNLPKLVIDDLAVKESKGFGSSRIHGALLLAQLDECLALKPDLRNQAAFVTAYLTKLRPGADVDWRADTAAREAYLDRVGSFVATLDPAHNSLKASVLYHRLVHDRARGIYDKGRFMAYLALPRAVGYANGDYLARDEMRRFPADLQADFRPAALIPPVGDDEPLVRSYLEHFFLTEDDPKPYEVYVNDVYVKQRLAETKVVNGLGDMEKWYSLLPPDVYQALKERVYIDFAPTNKTYFGTGEQIELDVAVKNVKTLLVKVFELNLVNYYRTNGREVDTAIDLDGLVANDEKSYTYEEPPLRRVTRHFAFPSVAGRGTYAIEFIGNGKSSRALVRKGKLAFLARTSVAGHVFTVLDEANRTVGDASLFIAGHEYRPDTTGAIVVPFSTRPGRQPIVLAQGDFASLYSFDHQAETYALAAGIYVDREALLARAKATAIVRPSLTLNGTPVTVAVLEEPTLVMTSIDGDGVATAKEIKGFKLFDDRESTYEFQVPANLASIAFRLQAKVQSVSRQKKIDLAAEETFTVNGIEATDKTEDLHVVFAGSQYFLDLLGKTGEAKPDRPVTVGLKHRDFRDPVTVALATDARGRIALGALPGVEWFEAKGPEGTSHRWSRFEDARTYPRALHGRAGETLRIPYLGTAKEPLRSEFSLLELRGGTFAGDRFEALGIEDGFLEVAKLPAGDYDLLLKRENVRMTLRLTAGEERDSYVLGPYRKLEAKDATPLHIRAVDATAEAVTIRLANASKLARVHVIATRFVPEYLVYGSLAVVAPPNPYAIAVARPETLYVTGRDIGDEYRYIIDRKAAPKYPGSMLARPSLLLSPWALRSTETGRQEAAAGGEYATKAPAVDGRTSGGRRQAGEPASAEVAGGFANLDFLGTPAVVLANLVPDEKGVVTLKRADLGPYQHIHIVAVDAVNAVFRQISLPEAAPEYADLRLAAALDPQGHYTEQKEIVVLGAGGELTLADMTTSSFELYDSLDKVHTLFRTLSKDPTLAEFGCILAWPKLKPEEKRAQYAKYACHELSFFLARKDPAFFEAVIKPYLKNKYRKTFFDRYLLGDPLDAYLAPWEYARLNVVERILLGQRIAAEAPRAARHVGDLFDLIPPDVERFNHLFATALKGQALETADRFKLGEAVEKAASLRSDVDRLERLSRTSGAGVGGGAPAKPAAPATAEALRRPEREENRAAPAADGAVTKRRGFAQAGAEKAAEEAEAEGEVMLGANALADLERRKAVRELYRVLDKTMEWVENDYYHLPIEKQDGDLVTVNGFWRDYARHDGKGPFLSSAIAEASHNFTEMMLALAVLDLPFEAATHASAVDGLRFTLKVASPGIAYRTSIKDAPAAADGAAVLVSQNFYRNGDRYREVGNERFDKFITGEFVVHTVYGCQVVVTNPTSTRQRLEVLLQIPRGAIPVAKGRQTKSVAIDIEPYRTWTADYFFYFPGPGTFKHYPVHVAKAGSLFGFAAPVAFTVVPKPTTVDESSWDHVSQYGTPEQVLSFLGARNVNRIKLDRIAWRMADPAFFTKAIAILAGRHAYDHTLWSYGIKHDLVPAIREFLKHADDFVNACGAAIESPLLAIDPIERRSYQHREYWPLVNARAHRLGAGRRILNDRFHEQYVRLMQILCYRKALDQDDLVGVVCYLLLQDRMEEALAFFGRVRPQEIAAQLEYDYGDAYLALAREDVRRAREIAAKYAAYPVDRWRNLFAAVSAELDEIEGKGTAVVDKDDRTQLQTRLAATEPSLELSVEAKQVTIRYQNLTRCRVNYYRMDIELLFSRAPFVDSFAGQRFASIVPNATAEVVLDAAKDAHTFALPAEFQRSNVLIEVAAGGVKKTATCFANALAVQLIENYAQLAVTHAETGKPLPTVYIKVYARMRDGTVRFYKDGYTDLRGRFEYGALSTNDMDFVARFAILLLSEEHGAAVREVAPPKR